MADLFGDKLFAIISDTFVEQNFEILIKTFVERIAPTLVCDHRIHAFNQCMDSMIYGIIIIISLLLLEITKHI